MKKIILLTVSLMAIMALMVTSCDTSDDDNSSLLLLLLMGGNTPFTLPDTGQTGCWDASGNVVTCDGTGQDGDYEDTPNEWTLTVTGNGMTVTDGTSGLVWQRCTRGQSGTGCTDTGTAGDNYGANTGRASYSNAVSYCDSLVLGGRSDWRVPSFQEMALFANYQNEDPAVDTTFYPATPVGGDYWTSTEYTGFPVVADQNYVMNINSGVFSFDSNIGAVELYVRCVAGSQVSEQDLTDRGDQTIYDSTTDLLWTKCEMNDSGDLLSGSDCSTGTPGDTDWQSALTFCEGLDHAGRTDWRLPSIRELTTIIYHDSGATFNIDDNYFPNAESSEWTSTSIRGLEDRAFYSSYRAGTMQTAVNKSVTMRVRCVATGE